MAQRLPTYTFGDLMSIIGRKSAPSAQNDLAVIICNQALNYVWDAFDWRESMSKLPNFYLVPNEQIYGAPAVIVPSDFYGLRWAKLVRVTNAPIPQRWDLAIIKDLQPTHVRALPASICYAGASKGFRVFPRTPDNIGSPDWLIEGVYKNRPTPVTLNTIATTTLPFDDMYLQMWVEVARWVLYTLDADPRAGAISVANGQTTYTGQAAVMRQMVEWAASREGLELGDPVIAPSEPLVSMGRMAGFPGLGGF